MTFKKELQLTLFKHTGEPNTKPALSIWFDVYPQASQMNCLVVQSHDMVIKDSKHQTLTITMIYIDKIHTDAYIFLTVPFIIFLIHTLDQKLNNRKCVQVLVRLKRL